MIETSTLKNSVRKVKNKLHELTREGKSNEITPELLHDIFEDIFKEIDVIDNNRSALRKACFNLANSI